MTMAKREKNKTTNNYLQNTTQKTNIETGRGLSSGDPDGLPVPLVVPVVLLLCDKPWMKNGPGWDYDKRNKSVAICDTDIQ